jgi:TPR repeat protein
LYTLARLHLDGAVIPHNMTKEQATKDAVAMMRRAAKLGYPPALEYLAAHGLKESPASQPVTQHES